ncbi:MAG: hypothetical protein LBM75_09160 [Myxococcales bacterium]|jgi:hypothetical protein|nr:hypothetical protein [Myxococcales bacterium]
MSSGFFTGGAVRAVNALVSQTLAIRLLTSWPSSESISIDSLQAVPVESFDPGAAPTVDAWVGVTDPGSNAQIRANQDPVSFGTLLQDLPSVVGWVAVDVEQPIFWGPFVDSHGAEVARSFVAGDELQFPALALRVGVV